MAKDYFQDILPPSDEGREPREIPHAPEIEAEEAPLPPERSIRNISVPTRARPISIERRETPMQPLAPRRRSRRLAWIGGAVVLVAIAAFAILSFRTTTVTVIPRSHTVVFDASNTFTAYPMASAPTSTLAYTLESFDIEDSAVVPTQGTQHAEHKASGAITVVNEFSTDPVHLIKNTRFETPNGLVFRTPADIVIPGMKGGSAGTVRITVIADQSGASYNVGPVTKFTLPGLKGGAMFAKVFARSSEAMTGGFSGDEPAAAPGELEAAMAQVRARLEVSIKERLASLGGTTFIELAAVTYQSMPNTSESATSVRIHEKAHVEVPVFNAKQFAAAVAMVVSADGADASITLVPGTGYGARAATSTVLGVDPIALSLAGEATLVWDVDAGALASALSGKDQGAFQTIVNSFQGVQEARARIEPFWKSTFPSDPSDIRINIEPVGAEKLD